MENSFRIADNIDMITKQACAKVNLTLEVLRRRGDGYHEVRTIMQAIDISDTLTFESATEINLVCSDSSLQNADNLVSKAALLLRDHANCREGARINLTKRIPGAAGLGGGSSNAAATLAGLNELWGLGLPLPDLAFLAAKLGSDVPFFLHGGTALAEGRGERITPLKRTLMNWIVLLFPEVAIPDKKTARLYGELSAKSFTTGDLTKGVVRRIETGLPLEDADLCNVFDDAAGVIFPGLEEFRKTAERKIGQRLHLAGSGPTLFAWCKEETNAMGIRQRLIAEDHSTHVARTTAPFP